MVVRLAALADIIVHTVGTLAQAESIKENPGRELQLGLVFITPRPTLKRVPFNGDAPQMSQVMLRWTTPSAQCPVDRKTHTSLSVVLS